MNGRFENRRVWLIGSALATVIIVAASWFLLIKPSLNDAASVRDQAAAAEDQNVQAAAQNARLARRFPQVPAMQTRLVALLKAVPATAALPEFTLEANSLAKANKVSLQNLTVATPAPVTAASGTAAPGTGTTTAPQTSAPVTTTPSPSSQPYQIGVTFTAEGTSAALVAYTKSMQHGTRDILVSGTTLSARSKAASTLTLTASIFTAPMTAGELKQTRELLKSTR